VDHEKYREFHDVLIRPLFAENIQFWYLTQKSDPRECSLELDAAIRLIDSMRKVSLNLNLLTCLLFFFFLLLIRLINDRLEIFDIL
jgi:hypothetical protein